MKVRVGDIEANCSCGSTEFREPHPAPFKTDEAFACADCGRTWTYGQLLDRIGETVMRRASDVLQSAKGNNRKNGVE